MKFTVDWFSSNIPALSEILSRLKGKPIAALEVGSFEGMSTAWLLENILTHPESRITCVDSFKGGFEHHEMGVDFSTTEERFVENMRPWWHKLFLAKGDSRVALPELGWQGARFDVAYIDGSHITSDVLMDACAIYPMMVRGGIMIFDDYGWTQYQDRPLYHPKLGIDSFLSCFAEKLKVVHKGYVVAVEVL